VKRSLGHSPRILIVLASANRRGAESQGVGLAEELRTRGFGVELVALRPAAAAVGLPVEVIGTNPYAVSTLWRLRRRAASADVVVAYGSVTLGACAISLNLLPCSFVYRSIGDPHAWARGHIHRMRTRLLLRRAKRVVVLFGDASTAMTAQYGIPSKQMCVISNARDPNSFQRVTPERRVAARQRLGLPLDAPVVCQVGSLSPEKRVPLGIAAVSGVPNAHLLIAGDGPEHGAVVEACSKLGERAHLLGIVSDVRAVLDASDVLLLTSRTEGMPGVAIEAGMCGIPTVASDVGASREAVGGGGVIVPPDAPVREYSLAIQQVLGEWERYAEAAFASSSQYAWANVGDVWECLFQALGRRQRARTAR